MDDGILMTIKKMLGLAEDYTAFDTDIIVFINSALMTLQQLAVGPKGGFIVTGVSETWGDFIPEGMNLEAVKQYVYLAVKMVFDPPSNSFVMDAMKQQKEEYEWRLREQAEFYPGDGSHPGYWQQIAKDEAAAATDDLDNGIGPFNGLKTGDAVEEGG